MERVLHEYTKRFEPAVCKGPCDNGGSFVSAKSVSVQMYVRCWLHRPNVRNQNLNALCFLLSAENLYLLKL